MTQITIKPSKKSDKKFDAVIDGKKTVSFGAKGYEDFTKHKDPERKELYLKRHKARENWNDPTTPGALSKFVLWNKQTISASVKDMNKHFPTHQIKYVP